MACPSPDASPRLAALGVLSTDGHAAYRDAIRATWLPPAHDEFVVRFVLRGGGAAAATLNESATFGDMLLVDAPARAGRKDGPLRSLLLWLGCAVRAWPNAQLVGKADDDTWARLPAVGRSLRGAQAHLAAAGYAHLYWGMVESYYWNVSSHRPALFGHKYRCIKCPLGEGGHRWSHDCARPARSTRGAGLHGPFFFAKGPLYFLSARVAAAIVADAAIAREAQAIVRSTLNRTRADVAAQRGAVLHGSTPWEDVWTGYAISRLAAPLRVGVVDIGWALFAEQ